MTGGDASGDNGGNGGSATIGWSPDNLPNVSFDLTGGTGIVSGQTALVKVH